jgi:hypothetical protein
MASPIELGTLLYTMVEPHRGHEVEYNRWYEDDHFYAGCMIGAHQFAGDRFVATRRLKDLRYPAVSPMTSDPSIGSYLAIYWVLKGAHEQWNRWAVDQVKDLHASGRMFLERDHIHTALYDHQWSLQRHERGTSIEQALDRPYAGLVVNVGEVAEGHTLDEVEAWTRDEWAPAAFDTAWGPDLIGSSVPMPLLDDAPPDVPRVQNAERRFLQLHFLTHDPADGWDDGYARFGERLDASGLATHLWTAPFIQTVFGTDTYTNELW